VSSETPETTAVRKLIREVPPAGAPRGVAILGTGSCVPSRMVTNKDLESVMDTSDEWIVQRTGIRERHIHSEERGENTTWLCTEAAKRALEDSGVSASEVDLVVAGTMTPDTPTPSVSSVTAARIGCGQIAAVDINAACSGFVYSINIAHQLVKGGMYNTAVVIGGDTITRHVQFSTFGRATSVLFGDAAAALVIRATADTKLGLIAQAMHSDGHGAKHLYIPSRLSDFAEGDERDPRSLNLVHMNGQHVFKFAVSTFPKLIAETLDKAGLKPEDVDHYICHQSNMRILAAARERFGLPESKLHVNIDRFGNTVGASVPLILDQQRRAGAVKPGQKVMFLAFGAGLTWASSLWQI